MKCREYKKWIHLNNTNELLDWEKIKLDEHLKTCSVCQELLSDIENKDLYIQKLKGVEPELTYPQALTSNVMQAIVSSEKTSILSVFFTKILDLLLSYKVRILAFTILVGLISLFSYQQLFIINKLNQMEKKITLRYEDNEVPLRTPFVINNKLLKEYASGTEDAQIVLDKRSLDRFLESYKDLKTDHDELLELLNDNLKNLEKKLSRKDIQKLKQLLKEDDLGKKFSVNL